jgi:hypothetical protein
LDKRATSSPTLFGVKNASRSCRPKKESGSPDAIWSESTGCGSRTVDRGIEAKALELATIAASTKRTKCVENSRGRACAGVEIQMSARSDLLVIDVYHLLDALQAGTIDVAFLVVPDDTLGKYLTDRGPKFENAVRHVERIGADKFPLRIIAIHHDGPGPPLAKQKKKKMDVEE